MKASLSRFSFQGVPSKAFRQLVVRVDSFIARPKLENDPGTCHSFHRWSPQRCGMFRRETFSLILDPHQQRCLAFWE